MFSNLFPQIPKLKSTLSQHPRLTALMCANVTLVAPTGLPESIHHLFADLPAPHLLLLPLCPGQLCASQGQLCARRAFPHHSHHPHLPLQLPTSQAVSLLPCPLSILFLPAFFQKHCQGNWASLSTARSDTAPLTAATSAKPTLWEHQQCQGAEGVDLSSQTHCPPQPAFFPCSRQSKAKASPQEPPLGPRNNMLLMAFPENTQQRIGQARKKTCFPLASPGLIHRQKRDLHLNGCWGIGCPWYHGHILHIPQSPC